MRLVPAVPQSMSRDDMEVLDLADQFGCERVLDAGADRPATLVFVDGRETWQARLDVADRGAAGHVGIQRVEGVADAGRESSTGESFFVSQLTPPHAVLPLMWPRRRRLQDQIPRCRTAIVADRAADQSAGYVEVGREAAPVRIAPGAAAVDADIETRPVVDRAT